MVMDSSTNNVQGWDIKVEWRAHQQEDMMGTLLSFSTNVLKKL